MKEETSRASLHARLRDGCVSPWHCLGVVMARVGEEVGSPVHFDADTAYLVPLWEAAERGLVDGPVVVEFGVWVDGRITTVGSTEVTGGIGRSVRNPSPSLVTGEFLPGGPRRVRSVWPTR